jgi:DNA-directed RNA polymerase specialized sigma24 family protein
MTQVDADALLKQARELSARYARRLGPDEAADLVGEALARGLERPPADGRMAPWLERIARNLMVDRWRHARVAARALPEPPTPAPTPEDLLLAGERRRAIRRLLARIERPQRRSILQRFYGGTISPGVAAATLRTRLHRALCELRARSRGLLSLVPPWGALRWLGLAANPAVVAVLLLAQQTPVSPPVVAAPPTVHVRPVVHNLPSPPPAALPAPARAHRAPAPLAPPAQRYDFEDDQIAADLQRPDDIVVDAAPRVRDSSHIEIPGSFVTANARSIEDL